MKVPAHVQMQPATYYLSSLDSIKFGQTRECVFLRQLWFDTGKECALVRLSPPVIGQEYGLADDLEELVLASRREDHGLFPIKEFPCFVFVARPLIEGIGQRDVISKNEVEIVGWGELYRTRHDADQRVFD